MRTLRPASRTTIGPPYAYEGERERLTEERRDIKRLLDGLPPKSRLRAGLEYRLTAITTRMLAIGDPSPVQPSSRRDLQ